MFVLNFVIIYLFEFLIIIDARKNDEGFTKTLVKMT